MEPRRIGADKFRRDLTEILNQVGYGDEEVIIERHGKPLAVVISYERYQGEEILRQVERVPYLAAKITAAREAAGITLEELEEQLRLERIRTLRERYPAYADEVSHADATPEPS
jgi:prevent-host-death family protein